MTSYKFNNVIRKALLKIVQEGITALADKNNYDTFTLTLDVDYVEAIKEESDEKI